MGKHFLVADIHLEPETDPVTWQTFFAFLDFVEKQKGNLYILGDLFDFWANNGIMKKKYRPLFEKLSKIASVAQVEILTGNRDFLLGKRVLSPWGINYLGNGKRLEIEGLKLFITHGDDFWDNDQNHRQYKRLGWPLIRVLDIIIPGHLANRLALKIRAKSKNSNGNKTNQAPINEKLLQEYFQANIDLIVCGHIHRPGSCEYPGNKRLIVLPDWKGTTGGYCLINDGRVDLREFER